MGGLISMYALCEYPDIFGGAACLSTHWPGLHIEEGYNPIPGSFVDYLRHQLPEPGSNKIYFDFGTETLDSLYAPYQQMVDAAMIMKGYRASDWITRKFEGADHSERSWHKRLHIPVEFLMGPE
jgi:pimeloyl-ACP methyl ester carboxylesterase